MFIQTVYPQQIFVVVIGSAATGIINIAAQNSMGIGVATGSHFPASIDEGMAGLGSYDGIDHDA